VEEKMDKKNGAVRELTELSEKELEQVCGGVSDNWTTENPGGQPHGASAVTKNKGGNAPGGHNEDLPPGQEAKL
jgi:hypothetical protein